MKRESKSSSFSRRSLKAPFRAGEDRERAKKREDIRIHGCRRGRRRGGAFSDSFAMISSFLVAHKHNSSLWIGFLVSLVTRAVSLSSYPYCSQNSAGRTTFTRLHHRRYQFRRTNVNRSAFVPEILPPRVLFLTARLGRVRVLLFPKGFFIEYEHQNG